MALALLAGGHRATCGGRTCVLTFLGLLRHLVITTQCSMQRSAGEQAPPYRVGLRPTFVTYGTKVGRIEFFRFVVLRIISDFEFRISNLPPKGPANHAEVA